MWGETVSWSVSARNSVWSAWTANEWAIWWSTWSGESNFSPLDNAITNMIVICHRPFQPVLFQQFSFRQLFAIQHHPALWPGIAVALAGFPFRFPINHWCLHQCEQWSWYCRFAWNAQRPMDTFVLLRMKREGEGKREKNQQVIKWQMTSSWCFFVRVKSLSFQSELETGKAPTHNLPASRLALDATLPRCDLRACAWACLTPPKSYFTQIRKYSTD